jgi:hypothetical protein
MLSTLDTIDLIGLETNLDLALEELEMSLPRPGQPDQSDRLLSAARALVDATENRVIQGREDVEANIKDLTEAERLLQRLGDEADGARDRVRAYLEAWLQQRDPES